MWNSLPFEQKCILTVWVLGVLWMIYRRVRTNFGRQPLRMGRMVIRMILLLLLFALLISDHYQSSQVIIANVLGILLGLTLAFWSTRNMIFERDSAGTFYYTPHNYPGYIIVVLILGRILYRLATLLFLSHSPDIQLAEINMMSQSPLTRALLCILLSYYIYYFIYIYWRSRKW